MGSVARLSRVGAWCAGFWAAGAAGLLAGCGGGAPEAPKNRVTIATAPESGARLLVDGVERGATPVTLESVAPGHIEIIATMDGYKRAVDRIQVTAEPLQQFTIDMQPVVGYVTFESSPPGASVTLDGTPIGAAPISNHAVSVGPHAYRFELADHHPASGEFEAQEDFKYAFEKTLKPMEATLTVLSRPGDATLWINNQRREEKTPAKLTLPPGNYIVGVYAEGYVQSQDKIVLKPNGAETVNVRLVEGLVPEGMVLVPGGLFTMGADGRAPDESPMREVMVETFFIDKNEVTNRQFKVVFPKHDFPKGQEDFPVSGVSWSQASEYARAAGKRLPTEAEWEKAARGDDLREFPWGKEFEAAHANTKERELGQTAKVGAHLDGMSPAGCFDMAGNVYEWVNDWYQAYPGNAQVTKDYGQVYRVLRGGSYDEPEFQARCARRHFDRMESKRKDYGFRCAKDAPRP